MSVLWKVECLFLLAMSTAFVSPSWGQDCGAEMEELRRQLWLGAVPAEFPELQEERCAEEEDAAAKVRALIESLGEPLGKLVEEALGAAPASQPGRLAEFLRSAENWCRRSGQGEAFEALGSRLSGGAEAVTDVEAPPPEGAEGCAALAPFIHRLEDETSRVQRGGLNNQLVQLRVHVADLENRFRNSSDSLGKRVRLSMSLTFVVLVVSMTALGLSLLASRSRGRVIRRLGALEEKHGMTLDGGEEESLHGHDLQEHELDVPEEVPQEATVYGTEATEASGSPVVAAAEPSSASQVRHLEALIEARVRAGIGKIEEEIRDLERELRQKPEGVGASPGLDMDEELRGGGAPDDARLRDGATGSGGQTVRRQPDREHATTARLDMLEQKVVGFANLLESTELAPPSPAASATGSGGTGLESRVIEESELLKMSWESFKSTHKDLAGRAVTHLSQKDAEGSPNDRSLSDRLVKILKDELASFPDLQRVAESVMAPLRDYTNRMQRLSMIPRVLGMHGEGLRESGDPKAQLLRVRDGLQLLTILQTTDLADRIRRFNLRGWLRDDFLRFADELLRTCQEAGGEREKLEAAWKTVEEALRFAGLAAIPLELGKTPFDSKVHIGRSDAYRRDSPDGVVVGVVRNGFRELDSGDIFQRPEVVVNRV